MKNIIPFGLLLLILGCSSDKTAEEFYKLGLQHFNQKEFLHALNNFDEALLLDENFAVAYLKRAQVNLIKDDYEAAFADLNKFLTFDTLVSEGYTQRAVLKYSLTDYYGSLSDCNKALIANPENADTYRIRGSIKKHFGNSLGAHQDLSNAIDLNNKDKKAYLLRGDVNLMRSKSEEACTDYQNAAELGSMQAYKRLVEYCTNDEPEIKVITSEKSEPKYVENEKIATAKTEKEKPASDELQGSNPDNKWHRLSDIRSNIYQIHTLTINREIRKGIPVEWGDMGPMDQTYVLIKEKENQIYNLQFIVEGEKAHEGFYKYVDAKENNITIYERIDGMWDEQLISNKPFEFVLEQLQTKGRTTLEIINYTRGVGSKVLF